MQVRILQGAPVPTLRGFYIDQDLLLIFVVQLLYKGTYHSRDTFHHIFHKTQLISFHHIGIYAEIKGHIKVIPNQLKTQESPLLPPLHLLFVISNCLHRRCPQCIKGSIYKYLGYLCTMHSITFSGGTLSCKPMWAYLSISTAEKRRRRFSTH